MLRTLPLIAILVVSGLRGGDDVDELRRALRHEQAIASLRAAVERGDAGAAARLAEASLEAALIARLEGKIPRGRRALVARLGKLELSASEQVTLARLAFLHDLPEPGETALGRARDLDADLKATTDRVLAAGRGEVLPEGGYFRYRGLWLPLAERDRERLFDLALEALWAVEPDRQTFRMEPTSAAPNRPILEERWKGTGVDFLRRRAKRVRGLLDEDYAVVRSWLTSYNAPAPRERLLESLEAMAEPRAAARKLIATYEKPQQPEVDDYRELLEGLYAAHTVLLVRDWRAVDTLDPAEAYSMVERVRSREEALAHLDRYLAAYEGGGLPAAAIVPLSRSQTSRGHVLPGREQSGLEDVLWLVLRHAADQHLDVMARAAELGRNTERLTPWERLVVRHVRERSIHAYNELVATSLDPTERECCTALDEYRVVLGLDPLEIEERLVVSARQHSQEMVDLGYFGHISPVKRNESPTDRARLEGFGGGVGENCLAGGASGRGAFEGWYHSPGHHRNLVSPGPQIGVGAAGGHHMWTLVVGGTDLSWRSLHRDMPPARRLELKALVAELIQKLARPGGGQEMSGGPWRRLTLWGRRAPR